MRPRVLAIGAGLALILVSLIAAPVAGSPGAAAAAARAEHERIVAYWTPERMASAIPRDLQIAGSPFIPAAPGGVKGKPPGSGGGGGGGGGDPTAVTGEDWPVDDAPVERQTGKVYFVVFPYAYVCSGAVASDSRGDYSLVLTAGHCVYDGKKGFVTNWMFVPDFDASPVSGYPPACDNTRFGCWTAQALVVHNGFASQRNFTTQATWYDWGFALVRPGGKTGESRQLDQAVGGSYPIHYSPGGTYPTATTPTRLAALGYPAAAPYDGRRLIYCAGNIFEDANNSNKTWGMKCNMTGGSSGGPWLSGFSESNGTGGTLSSVNSYRYSGGDSMYGPKFNGFTQDTYDAANGATSSTIVP